MPGSSNGLSTAEQIQKLMGPIIYEKPITSFITLIENFARSENLIIKKLNFEN